MGSGIYEEIYHFRAPDYLCRDDPCGRVHGFGVFGYTSHANSPDHLCHGDRYPDCNT